MVCIIDDREDVWNYATNLVHVKPYSFFRGTADINAPLCLDKAGAEESDKNAKIPARKATVVKVPRRKPQEEALLPANRNKQKSSKGDECCATKTEEAMEHGRSDTDAASSQPGQNTTRCGTIEGTQNDRVEENMTEKQTNSETTCEPAKESGTDKTEPADIKEDSGINKPKSADIKEQSGKDKTESVPADIKEETGIGKPESSDIKEESRRDNTKSADIKEESDTDKTESASIKEESITDKEKTLNGMQSLQNPTDDKNGGSVVHEDISGSGVVSSAVEKIDTDTPSTEQSSETQEEYEEMIEWEDDDDYLLYLETVLQRIHTAFYKVHDQLKKAAPGDPGPDLKSIIPYVRKKVLKGCNIVFSGMFPTNQPPEKSRAYCMATSLGATIQPVLVALEGNNEASATTHMVAARMGTSKVNAAKKFPGVHIVNANWLWCCSERWEAVDERLFPLTDQTSASYSCNSPDVTKQQNSGCKRKTTEDIVTLAVYDPVTGKRISNKKPKLAESKLNGDVTMTDEGNVTMPSTSRREQRFSESYNPLYAFSKDDIASMDKEVEEIFDESESSDSEDELRRKVLGQRDSSSSEADSLSGEFPRGWKKKPCKRDAEEEDGEEGSDSENIQGVVDENSRETTEDDDFDDSIGSVDEEMAAAVEKEFLSM